MKKLSTIALTLLSVTLFSQKQHDFCGTMEHNERLIQSNPLYEQVWQQLNAKPELVANHRGGGTFITIPVVVHVVYKTGAQNISDAQILSQIDVLNEDFGRTNADTGNTWPVFKPIAADTEIKFCMAVRDPNNDSTTGITRTQTNTNVFTVAGDEVKRLSTGGADAWPADQYLNIWVCNLENTVLGYAQFPGMNPATDGVAVHFQAMGRWPDNPFSAQFKGRTGTHEVGHWLNLRHVWGDGNCLLDDQVDDTPLQNGEQFVCGSFNSCVDTPVDYNDMIQNYMQYSSDGCQNLFTIGQTQRMHAAITTFRGNLHNSLGCYSVNNPPIVDFVADAVEVCAGDTVTFTDLSLNFPNTHDWTFTGGNPSSSIAKTPKVVYGSEGTYTVKLVAGNVYGSDSLTKTMYITVTGATDIVPVSEGFESPTFPPVKWSLDNPDTDRTWEHETGVGGFGASSSSMVFDNLSTPDPSGKQDMLLTQKLDFTGVVDPFVTFDVAYARHSVPRSDTLKVQYSTDCGKTWTTVWSKAGSTLATAPDQTTAFTPTANQWRKDSVSLAFLAGTPIVSVGLVNCSGFGNNLYVDNINLNSTAQAAPIAAFSADTLSGCAGTEITFIDESTNQPSGWNWTFSGGTPSCTTCQNPVVTFDNSGLFNVTLTVTNAQGNDTETKNAYIDIFPQPEVTISKTDVECFGQSTGSATANVTGGTPSFTYAWTGGGVQPTKSNLSAGPYTVTVTDAKGCRAIKSVTVIQNQDIVVITDSDPNTGGGNGSATVSAVGGTAPLTYQWDDPSSQTTPVATGLYGGTYKCTITDALGCTKVATVVVGGPTDVNEPGVLSFSIAPNPSHGSVLLTFDGEVEQVTVFSSLGQIVQVNKVPSNTRKTLLDLTQLQSGVYLVEATGTGGSGRASLVLNSAH